MNKKFSEYWGPLPKLGQLPGAFVVLSWVVLTGDHSIALYRPQNSPQLPPEATSSQIESCLRKLEVDSGGFYGPF